MENFISGGLNYLFPGECYQTMVEEFNFFDGQFSWLKILLPAHFLKNSLFPSLLSFT